MTYVRAALAREAKNAQRVHAVRRNPTGCVIRVRKNDLGLRVAESSLP